MQVMALAGQAVFATCTTILNGTWHVWYVCWVCWAWLAGWFASSHHSITVQLVQLWQEVHLLLVPSWAAVDELRAWLGM